MIRNTLVLLLAATALTAPLAAQEDGDKKGGSHAEAAKAEAEAAWARAPIDDSEVRHRDSVTINGRSYPYIASAGTLTVRAQSTSVGTRWMLENLREGMRIKAIGPGGIFVPDVPADRKLLLISAGSGVTPMMAFDPGEPGVVGLSHQTGTVALVNEDVDKHLLIGFPWSANKPANTVYPLRVHTLTDPSYPTLYPSVTRPIAPNSVEEFHLSLRLGPGGSTVRQLAQDVYARFATMFARLHGLGVHARRARNRIRARHSAASHSGLAPLACSEPSTTSTSSNGSRPRRAQRIST